VSQAIAQAQGKAVPTLAGPATAPAPEQKAKRSKVLAGVGPAWHKTLDVVEPFARWIFGFALFITAGALLMLAIGVFTGNISQMKDDPSGHKVLSDLMLASTVLRWSCIALGITGLILAFDEQAAGPLVALAGVGLTFGIPWLLKMQIGKEASDAAQYAAKHIAIQLMPAGYTLLAIGLFKSAIDMSIWMIGLPDRVKQRADVGVGREEEPAQQRAARDANMFSPCWKLPFCREVIRKQCPAYLAKKRCWKFGRGCYCDEEMISRIIRGESIDVIKAPTRMSREGKAPCGRCYIYLEHQAHKYRAMSPLALPITIGLMLLIWKPYTAVFGEINKHMDVFWQRLSFEPTNFAPKAIAVDTKVVSQTDASGVGNLSPEQIGHVAMIIFGVLIGFFLLIYVSKMIEWAIYKAKL
jgi:hypothetical protein